jgi:hypothetical protein
VQKFASPQKNPKQDLYTTTTIYSSKIMGTGTEPQKGNQNKGRSQMLHTHLQTKIKEPQKEKKTVGPDGSKQLENKRTARCGYIGDPMRVDFSLYKDTNT